MGLFGRNKEVKKNEHTFYMIAETTKEGSLTTEQLLRPDFPVFEDKEEARVFSILLKYRGIKASPFGMKYTKELMDELIEKKWIFIGKKDDDIDYSCWSCPALFSHKHVKWKLRTYKSSDLSKGDPELEKLQKEYLKINGIKDEHTASPNQIFNGREYEYRGNCPKCNSVVNCYWFGIESLKKNPNAIVNSLNISCPECKNIMRREFQLWFSIRLGNNYEDVEEFLITLCPKCKARITYDRKCDFNHGIIE